MVFVGTSGFYYREWVGCFYPPRLKPKEWLNYYGERFNGLEVNSTFYGPPSAERVKGWSEKAPKLHFSFKLYREITHGRDLNPQWLDPFLQTEELLKDRLICFLAQFPKSFTPSKENRKFLKELVNLLSPKVCVELRAKEWEGEGQFLKELGAPVVKNFSPPSLNWFSKGFATKELAYFRFHGPKELYRGSYREEFLKKVAKKVKELPSEKVALFFNNSRDCSAPQDAQKLLKLLGEEVSEEEEQERDDSNRSSGRGV